MFVVRQNIEASMSENKSSHFTDVKHRPTIYHLNSNFKFGNSFSLVVCSNFQGWEELQTSLWIPGAYSTWNCVSISDFCFQFSTISLLLNFNTVFDNQPMCHHYYINHQQKIENIANNYTAKKFMHV